MEASSASHGGPAKLTDSQASDVHPEHLVGFAIGALHVCKALIEGFYSAALDSHSRKLSVSGREPLRQKMLEAIVAGSERPSEIVSVVRSDKYHVARAIGELEDTGAD